ncbi:hypothetical protein SAMN02787142_8115 [Burkholderia sp. WP9]|nr:hypothetical protein SAMN02787142_8115 [Burkholderia sp. WP9]
MNSWSSNSCAKHASTRSCFPMWSTSPRSISARPSAPSTTCARCCARLLISPGKPATNGRQRPNDTRPTRKHSGSPPRSRCDRRGLLRLQYLATDLCGRRCRYGHRPRMRGGRTTRQRRKLAGRFRCRDLQRALGSRYAGARGSIRRQASAGQRGPAGGNASPARPRDAAGPHRGGRRTLAEMTKLLRATVAGVRTQ